MPNQMPDDHFSNKPRAKITVQDAPGESRIHKPSVKQTAETIDWLAWWSLSIALSALVMAAIVYFNDADTVGASVILAGAAGIVALVLFFSEAPTKND